MSDFRPMSSRAEDYLLRETLFRRKKRSDRRPQLITKKGTRREGV